MGYKKLTSKSELEIKVFHKNFERSLNNFKKIFSRFQQNGFDFPGFVNKIYEWVLSRKIPGLINIHKKDSFGINSY